MISIDEHAHPEFQVSGDGCNDFNFLGWWSALHRLVWSGERWDKYKIICLDIYLDSIQMLPIRMSWATVLVTPHKMNPFWGSLCLRRKYARTAALSCLMVSLWWRLSSHIGLKGWWNILIHRFYSFDFFGVYYFVSGVPNQFMRFKPWKNQLALSLGREINGQGHLKPHAQNLWEITILPGPILFSAMPIETPDSTHFFPKICSVDERDTRSILVWHIDSEVCQYFEMSLDQGWPSLVYTARI